jgi:membrane-bound metal-dependent hydrolase YbcI (DUF457 family)
MNRAAHLVAGVVAGAGGYYLVSRIVGFKPTWGQALLCGALGAGVACLPDFLEPPVKPHHRAFFHSIAFNALIAYGIRQVWQNANAGLQAKVVVTVLGFGFMSHPLLDATTPMGLPLV